MTRQPAARVPCAVCVSLIDRWDPLPDDRYRAVPCGHTLDDQGEQWRQGLLRRIYVSEQRAGDD